MNIPYYRILEMNKLYEAFCHDENNSYKIIDLNERKKKLKTIIKTKYKWLNDNEYNNFYKTIKEKEIDLYLEFKKKEISNKYREKIIKLFCVSDSNNNNLINIDEFKMIMIRFNINDYNQIKKMFKNADINNDGDLSIDEFIEFLAKNNNLLQDIDTILDCKFELKKRLDKRNILFKNFPGSPIKLWNSWRPCLANLRTPRSIQKQI
jgi:Ca2+-binding EF-hand superfamily protein